MVSELIPYVRETFRRHLNQAEAVLLVDFDKLKRVSCFLFPDETSTPFLLVFCFLFCFEKVTPKKKTRNPWKASHVSTPVTWHILILGVLSFRLHGAIHGAILSKILFDK